MPLLSLPQQNPFVRLNFKPCLIAISAALLISSGESSLPFSMDLLFYLGVLQL